MADNSEFKQIPDWEFQFEPKERKTEGHPFIYTRGSIIPARSREILSVPGTFIYACDFPLIPDENGVDVPMELIMKAEEQDLHFNSGLRIDDHPQYTFRNNAGFIPLEYSYNLLINHVDATDIVKAFQITRSISTALRNRSLSLLYVSDHVNDRVFVIVGVTGSNDGKEVGMIFAILDNKSLPLGLQIDLFGHRKKNTSNE